MTALDLIGLVNQILFVGLFVAVLFHALKRPSRAGADTALLFGSIAAVVLIARVVPILGVAGEPWVVGLQLLLLNTAPFAMLRLVDDFSGTPRWVQATGTAALAIVGVMGFVMAPDVSLVAVATIGLFIAVGGYAAAAFAVESRRTRGITHRRMAAVALGAFAFIGAVIALFLGAIAPAIQPATALVSQGLALVAVLAFFLGFATPSWVRRAWREPDLRGFLERSVHLTAVADERAALLEMERAAATAFGVTGASIGIADRDREVLRYPEADGWSEHPADAFVAGRAFTEQRRVIAVDAATADPENAELYVASRARTVIAAPISTDDRRLGVLAIYAERSPLFIEDDLWLLELLADQAAVLIEARTLATHASELRAREEAAQLKEEFLSAAAHDLRTPLTVVLGQAELLERRLERDPSSLVDPAGIRRIAKEARRLRDLVVDLLDAQRLEEARAVMELRPADLRTVVQEVGQRYAEHGRQLAVSVPEMPVIGRIDPPRVEQVIENLVDNALKYGAEGEVPRLVLESDGAGATLSVVDRGIGIPEAERGRVFERFFRASNAHGVTDTGIGLGLAICRRIVEEHGGTIRYTPTLGGGSTFSVRLPVIGDPTPPERSFAPAPSALPVHGGEAAADA